MKKKYILSIGIVLAVIVFLGILFYPNVKRSRESLKYTKLGDELWNQAIEKTDIVLVNQAAKQYEEALRINSKNVDACLLLGAIYTGKGKHEEALALYKKAVKIKPRSVEAHWFLAHQYDLMGMDAEADNEYKKILELDPDNFSAQLHLGMIEPKKDISIADISQDPELSKIFALGIVLREAQKKEKK